MTQLTAFVQIPAAAAIELICAQAEALGAHVTRDGDSATVQASGGTLGARPLNDGLELRLVAETTQDLDIMRDAIDDFARHSGIALPDWRSAPADDRVKSRLMTASLVEKRRISPSFYRIRLAGDFAVFASGGLHFRLLIGPEGSAWPRAGAEGIDWPHGIDAWHRPPYTVRAIGPKADWLDFDVFLHEGGRVTQWCEDTTPGARVMLTGPGGRGVKQAAWMGIIGDETALPVVLRAIEAAGPDTLGEAAILITDAADIQPVAAPKGLKLRWVLRQEGKGLLDLLAGLSLPDAGDRAVFLAGERSEAEAARVWARDAGLGAREFTAAAYWTAGWVPPAKQRQAKRRAVSPADTE